MSRWSRLLWALVLSGCSCSRAMGPPDDAGAGDGGAPSMDAGDAGSVADAGSDAAIDAPVDAGAPEADAGPPVLDGGPLPDIRYLTCEEAAAARSYLGCDYWPASTPNAVDPSRFSFAVAVGNPNLTDVTIHVGGGSPAVSRDFVVAPGATHTEILPWVTSLSSGHPGVAASAAYHLTSDLPVAVYQFSPLEYTDGLGSDPTHASWSNDASLLLPSTALGTSYRALTWPTDTGGAAGTVVVVATSPGATTIDVRLADRARPFESGGYPSSAGSTATVTLAQGDAFLVMSGHPLDGSSACGDLADLTGTTIEATQPVAVYVGHECTNVPCGVLYCDHLEEQLFPTITWGRDYVVSALRERGDGEPSVIRILSAEDGNALTFDGIPAPSGCPSVLAAGEVCELQTVADFAVRGTRPMLVAQFMVGQDTIAGASGGDPAMVLEVPTFQFRTDYVIVVPDTYVESFVTVVHPNGLPPALDGTRVPAGAPVGTSGYSVSRFSVTPGTHRLRGARFGVKVSGVAPYTSYVYPGGLDLADNGLF